VNTISAQSAERSSSAVSLAAAGQHWQESGAGDGNRKYRPEDKSMAITVLRIGLIAACDFCVKVDATPAIAGQTQPKKTPRLRARCERHSGRCNGGL
jgi:hypothetical protein